MQCGSTFAPVIEYVINLVYQLMKALQSVIYVFSGINIFAKATANSMNKTANSASKTNKSLARVHNEINNVSNNNGGGGSGSVTPTMDLSEVDASMNTWIEKIKGKLVPLFEPVKKSWNKYIVPMLKSTINTLKNIGKAFKNAWKNNDGIKIVKNLARSFENLMDIILSVHQTFENWTASTSFQAYANSIISLCKTLSSWFEKITLKLKEIWEDGGKQTFTKLLEFISKLTNAVSAFLEFLSPAIDLLVDLVGDAVNTIIKVIGDVLDALGGLLDFMTGVFTGDWEKAWNGIKTIFYGICNAIIDLVKGLWNQIKIYCDNIKESWNKSWASIKEFSFNIFNTLLDKIDSIFPGMKNIILTNLLNVKNKIDTTLNAIKVGWDTIWTKVKQSTVNQWNAIYNAIKVPINWILSGVEKMSNGVVTGVNQVIRCLNNMHFKMPDWLGGGSFGINLPLMSYVSLPRLAKGNVAYSETAAIFGEYLGASSNPEITTPQNIMRETFEDVLSRNEWNNKGSTQHLSIYYMGKEIFDDTIDYINEKTRRTGKCVIKVGG